MAEEEKIEDEEELATMLEAEQELNQAQSSVLQLAEEGQNFRRPSLLKYGFLFLVAGFVDYIDLVDLFGGVVISKIISIGGTGIIYFTLWLTDGKMKRAQAHGEEMEAALLSFRQDISRYSRFAMRTAKTMQKIPGLKGMGRRLPRTMVKIRRIARRNPMTKILVGGAINLVPYVAIVNLMVFWIYLSYRDEKKTFQGAREASAEAMEQIEASQAA